ncbi:DEKNAAC102118 [Brettanomyces naardenensis]|uniref:rRNA methyltransferase 1, mitochondrial n=1 Tax=Brettanomyces naardenensis TaxID=13370 RepID=A0A448YJW8_BRENA|nr:DEKNAAC102118 [Brettanomyces naardenensis]
MERGLLRRLLHTSGYKLKYVPGTSGPRQPRAPFKTQFSESGKPVSFEKNIPVYRRVKAWERDGVEKGEWFRKHHAGHHAEQKRREEEMGNRRHRDREIDDRERHQTGKEGMKNALSRLRLDPLVDYLYGSNPVLAALRSGNRSTFGRLYLHNPKETEKVESIVELAKEKNVVVAKDSSKQELNQMTNNGVHNGVVLETRPLEVEDLKCLNESSKESFSVEKESLGDTFAEEIVKTTDPLRYPLGIYLDEISDPHNVGAVLRSAYFLGVDFVVLSEKNCASLTPLVSKASSGAMEFLPIFSSAKPLKFFEESAKNGWSVISTVAPSQISKFQDKAITDDELSDVVHRSPVLLVVGSEGTGIRRNLINRSTYVVGMDGRRPELDESVDSLNVSVATALLVEKLTN